jgi:hypothetical protein
MNDEELITLVREQRTKVPMTVPVEEILSRGRAVRARRRIPGLAGVLAVAAGAAVAVAVLVPYGHQRPGQPGAQLAAWTVTKQADGDVYVTIRELRDPAGLQATLRADGVPAYVSTTSAACLRWTGSSAFPPGFLPLKTRAQASRGVAMVIDPAAIPRGTALGIVDIPPAGTHPAGAIAEWGLAVGLVHAGQQLCAGS